jgi:hypothetical protein
MKGFFVFIFVGLIVFMTYYVAVHDKKLIGPKLLDIKDQVLVLTGIEKEKINDVHCALHYISPIHSSHVTNPFTIEVIVDNSQDSCRWGVFEGEAGSVELYDEYGKLQDKGILTTTSDWMTDSPTTYRASLSEFTHKGKSKLLFKENNPKGDKPQESYITVIVD